MLHRGNIGQELWQHATAVQACKPQRLVDALIAGVRPQDLLKASVEKDKESKHLEHIDSEDFKKLRQANNAVRLGKAAAAAMWALAANRELRHRLVDLKLVEHVLQMLLVTIEECPEAPAKEGGDIISQLQETLLGLLAVLVCDERGRRVLTAPDITLQFLEGTATLLCPLSAYHVLCKFSKEGANAALRQTAISVLCCALNYDAKARAQFSEYGGQNHLPEMLRGLGADLMLPAGRSGYSTFSVSVCAASIITQFGKSRSGRELLFKGGYIDDMMAPLMSLVQQQIHAIGLAVKAGKQGFGIKCAQGITQHALGKSGMLGLESLIYALMVACKGTIREVLAGRLGSDELLEVVHQCIQALGQTVKEALGAPAGPVILSEALQMQLISNLVEFARHPTCAGIMLEDATWSRLGWPSGHFLQIIQSLLKDITADRDRSEGSSNPAKLKKAKCVNQRPMGVRHLAMATMLCLAIHRAETNENSALEESLKGQHCARLIDLGALEVVLTAAVETLPAAKRESKAALNKSKPPAGTEGAGVFVMGATAVIMYLVADEAMLTSKQVAEVLLLCREGPMVARRYAAAGLWCVARQPALVCHLVACGALGLEQCSLGVMLYNILPNLLKWVDHEPSDPHEKAATLEYMNWVLATILLLLNHRMGLRNRHLSRMSSTHMDGIAEEGEEEEEAEDGAGDVEEAMNTKDEELRLLLQVMHQILELEGLLQSEELERSKYLALCMIYRLVDSTNDSQADILTPMITSGVLLRLAEDLQHSESLRLAAANLYLVVCEACHYLPDGNPASTTAADDAKERALEQRELRAEYTECAEVNQSPSNETDDKEGGTQPGSSPTGGKEAEAKEGDGMLKTGSSPASANPKVHFDVDVKVRERPQKSDPHQLALKMLHHPTRAFKEIGVHLCGHLAYHRKHSQHVLVQGGAVESLVPFVQRKDPMMLVTALKALLNLSTIKEGQARICKPLLRDLLDMNAQPLTPGNAEIIMLSSGLLTNMFLNPANRTRCALDTTPCMLTPDNAEIIMLSSGLLTNMFLNPANRTRCALDTTPCMFVKAPDGQCTSPSMKHRPAGPRTA